MNTTDKHQALRQALAPTEPKQLPSNFAYNTLHRIRLEQRERESRQRIVAFIVIVAVSLFGIGLLVNTFGMRLWESLAVMLRQPNAFSLVLPTCFCLVFFALLNHFLSRHYGSGIAHTNP